MQQHGEKAAVIIRHEGFTVCLTLMDLCTCRTHPPGLPPPYLPTVYNHVFFLFQLDEKCDKQYSDYSRVSAPLFLYFTF